MLGQLIVSCGMNNSVMAVFIIILVFLFLYYLFILLSLFVKYKNILMKSDSGQ